MAGTTRGSGGSRATIVVVEVVVLATLLVGSTPADAVAMLREVSIPCLWGPAVVVAVVAIAAAGRAVTTARTAQVGMAAKIAQGTAAGRVAIAAGIAPAMADPKVVIAAAATTEVNLPAAMAAATAEEAEEEDPAVVLQHHRRVLTTAPSDRTLTMAPADLSRRDNRRELVEATVVEVVVGPMAAAVAQAALAAMAGGAEGHRASCRKQLGGIWSKVSKLWRVI